MLANVIKIGSVFFLLLVVLLAIVLGYKIKSGGAVGTNENILLDADPTAVACGSDDLVAVGGWDATITIFDVRNAKQSFTLVPPDGRYPGFAEARNTVYDSVFGKPPPIVRSLAFFPNRKLLACGCQDDSIYIWDLSERKVSRIITLPGNTIEGTTNDVFSVAVSPDSQLVASASFDGVIRIWDANTGKLIRPMTGHEGIAYAVSFSPDQQTLASSGADTTIRIWRIEDGQELRTLIGHDEKVWSVAFSNDGAYLASCGGDFQRQNSMAELKLWNARTGDLIANLKGHKWPACSVVFSSDSRSLISGGGDAYKKCGEILVWDVRSKEIRYRLNEKTNMVNSVTQTPDGEYVIAAEQDKTARIWKLPRK